VPAFTDQEVIQVWETGLEQHPVDRALTVLAAAFPGSTRDELAAMSVGRRDERLMDAREMNFGPTVSGVAECPGCGEFLEWTLDLDSVRSPRTDAGDSGPMGLALEGYDLLYRLPNSTDLAVIALGGDVDGGRAALLRRCVLEVRRDGVTIDPASLPEAVAVGLAGEMEARDPQAETLLGFECPACGFGWEALFDVLPFLWAEIQSRARRLLGEVHGLARAYGWSEYAILEMSPVRRRFYLEAAT
jgi:hypothetical protein